MKHILIVALTGLGVAAGGALVAITWEATAPVSGRLVVFVERGR